MGTISWKGVVPVPLSVEPSSGRPQCPGWPITLCLLTGLYSFIITYFVSDFICTLHEFQLNLTLNWTMSLAVQPALALPFGLCVRNNSALLAAPFTVVPLTDQARTCWILSHLIRDDDESRSGNLKLRAERLWGRRHWSWVPLIAAF